MPQVALTLATLDQVKGGMVSLMLEKALIRMVQDIEAASDIPDWRKVTLEIRAKPVLDMGNLDEVAVEFVVAGKVPNRVTSSRMISRQNPAGHRLLHFSVDADDNPHQTTIHDLENGEE